MKSYSSIPPKRVIDNSAIQVQLFLVLDDDVLPIGDPVGRILDVLIPKVEKSIEQIEAETRRIGLIDSTVRISSLSLSLCLRVGR